MRRAVVRSLAWQIYGGLLSTATALVFVFEIGWWMFFVRARTLLTPIWTGSIHGAAVVICAGVIHYVRTRHARKQDMDAAGPAADLDGRGFDFRVGPFAVKVEYVFLIMLLLLGFMTGDLIRAAAFVVSGFGAVLLHELGHALAARQSGHVASIHLHMLGGTTFHLGRALTRARNAYITLAGPLLALLAGGVAFALLKFFHPRSDRIEGILFDIVVVTAGWSLLNLLPILPLDGGRVVYAVASPERAYWTSGLLSLTGAGLSLWMEKEGLAITFVLLASSNLAETRMGQRLAEWSAAIERRRR